MSKVGIIAIAKNENLYLREWIEHHLGLGFDQIIIGLNDDEFKPLILNPQVIYEDYHGVDKVQSLAYTELYKKYRKDFDWLFFCDIDEFVMLEKGNIKDFLQGFDCDVVRLSCKHFSDMDMLDTDGDYRVVERFTQPYLTSADTFVKSFINTKIEPGERKFYGHGIYDKTLDARNALNDPCENYNQHTTRIVHEIAWLNHYPTKTMGEYIRQKWKRGGANGNPGRYSDWEKYFFRTNRKTQEKIDYANKLINEINNSYELD
jgi:hypothetical protein